MHWHSAGDGVRDTGGVLDGVRDTDGVSEVVADTDAEPVAEGLDDTERDALADGVEVGGRALNSTVTQLTIPRFCTSNGWPVPPPGLPADP